MNLFSQLQRKLLPVAETAGKVVEITPLSISVATSRGIKLFTNTGQFAKDDSVVIIGGNVFKRSTGGGRIIEV